MNTIYLSSNKLSSSNNESEQFPMHTHDNYEIYCFLGEHARYTVEGNIYPLEKGDILLMRKGEAHFFMPQEKDKNHIYERIIVNFDFLNYQNEFINQKLMSVFNDRPLGKYNRYPAALFEDKNWIYYLEKICSCKVNEQKELYLLVLLQELYENFETVKTNAHDFEANSSKSIINYINRHLTETLSLDTICEKFFISKSQLNRNFKKTNGSTVWEYITAKRLLLAKEMLQNGGRPTEVYLSCGFNDYVTFYKAYKKHFSVSPQKISL